jgi:hypothetical protein
MLSGFVVWVMFRGEFKYHVTSILLRLNQRYVALKKFLMLSMVSVFCCRGIVLSEHQALKCSIRGLLRDIFSPFVHRIIDQKFFSR